MVARKWTKRAAVGRLGKNELAQEAMRLEPKVREAIEKAKAQKNEEGYDRLWTYLDLKKIVVQYVGWLAQKPELKTSEHYAAVIEAINDLLPPDDDDLVIWD